MKKFLVTALVLIVSATVANALDLKKVNKDTNLSDTAEMKTMNASLRAVQNEKGPIVFVTGKADLDVAKCRKTLDTLATIVKKYPRFKVQVEGYTDNVGKKESNLKLSQKRAEAGVARFGKNGGLCMGDRFRHLPLGERSLRLAEGHIGARRHVGGAAGKRKACHSRGDDERKAGAGCRVAVHGHSPP